MLECLAIGSLPYNNVSDAIEAVETYFDKIQNFYSHKEGNVKNLAQKN